MRKYTYWVASSHPIDKKLLSKLSNFSNLFCNFVKTQIKMIATLQVEITDSLLYQIGWQTLQQQLNDFLAQQQIKLLAANFIAEIETQQEDLADMEQVRSEVWTTYKQNFYKNRL